MDARAPRGGSEDVEAARKARPDELLGFVGRGREEHVAVVERSLDRDPVARIRSDHDQPRRGRRHRHARVAGVIAFVVHGFHSGRNGRVDALFKSP